MAKPLSRILVIEDEPLSLREIVKDLNAAARALDNPLGITFSGVATAKEALAAIDADGDIQAVLVDDKLYSLPGGKKNGGRKKLQMSALELVQRFARFHPEFRPTALEAGADYATQSTHKVLSAFSQASMIHVNDPDFREHLFRENFNMHTSTSPQYGLIASLDVARKQAVMEGYKLLQRTLRLAKELRRQINSTGVFRVLELADLLPDEVRGDGIRLDITKVTVDVSRCGYTVDDLQKELFDRFNIQIEKSTFNTITLLLTIGTTRSKVSRLYDALMRLAREGRAPRHLVRTPDIPALTKLRYLPRDAYYCGGELVPVFDDKERVNRKLAHRVCADGIVHEGYQPCIRVLRPAEERGLRRIG